MMPARDIPPEILEGAIMRLHGRLRWNPQRETWAVEIRWQGRRRYFSQIETSSGVYTCVYEVLAQELQRQISLDIERGTFRPERYDAKRPIHLRQYAEAWLKAQHLATRTKPSTLKWATYKTYRAAVSNWIIPALGERFLPDISHADYVFLWSEIPRSPKYRKNILTTLYQIMGDARREGHTGQVPEKIVFKGRYEIPSTVPKWLDAEAQAAILEQIDPRDRPVFLFQQAYGVRISEARALQKSDIYFGRREVVIRYTMAPVESGGEAPKEVKQKRERVLPLYDDVAEVLRPLIPGPPGFVFTNWRTGKPYGKNINRVWNPACEAALGYVFPLNTAGRHSWACQMARAGVPMDLIGDGLGHSNSKTTRDFYAVSNLERLRAVRSKIRRVG